MAPFSSPKSDTGSGTNWRAMLKDKKLWLGVGVAAAIGLAVFLKKGGSTGGASPGPGGATGTSNPSTAGWYQGGADTTGTDIASFLSSYSSALQGQQTEFQQQIKDTITALLEQQGGGSTTPNTPNTPATWDVKGGNHLTHILQSVNAANPGLYLSREKFLELNPTLKLAQANERGFLSPTNQGGNILEVFGAPGTYRIK